MFPVGLQCNSTLCCVSNDEYLGPIGVCVLEVFILQSCYVYVLDCGNIPVQMSYWLIEYLVIHAPKCDPVVNIRLLICLINVVPTETSFLHEDYTQQYIRI